MTFRMRQNFAISCYYYYHYYYYYYYYYYRHNSQVIATTPKTSNRKDHTKLGNQASAVSIFSCYSVLAQVTSLTTKLNTVN